MSLCDYSFLKYTQTNICGRAALNGRLQCFFFYCSVLYNVTADYLYCVIIDFPFPSMHKCLINGFLSVCATINLSFFVRVSIDYGRKSNVLNQELKMCSRLS